MFPPLVLTRSGNAGRASYAPLSLFLQQAPRCIDYDGFKYTLKSVHVNPFAQDVHGLTKVVDTFPCSTNSTAKNAKSAKIFDFLCGLSELCGSEFLSGISLAKPWWKFHGFSKARNSSTRDNQGRDAKQARKKRRKTSALFDNQIILLILSQQRRYVFIQYAAADCTGPCVTDRSTATDHVRIGKACIFEHHQRGIRWIEPNVELQALGLGKLGYGILRFSGFDGNDHEPLCCMSLIIRFKRRHFRLAGRAPGRPVIHQ